MFGIYEKSYKQLINLFPKFPEIKKVIIYGSRAMGTSNEGSDIDISLHGEKLDYKLVNKLHTEIENLNTPYFYDISIYEKLNNDNLKNHIDRFGKVLYEKM
jgi:predicted nucleotidyltransferase